MSTRNAYVAGGIALALIGGLIIWTQTSRTASGSAEPVVSPAATLNQATRNTHDLRDAADGLGKVVSHITSDTKMPVEVRQQRLAAALKSLKTFDGLVPRETFDFDLVAGQEGHDPVRLYQWVRDRTRPVPYRGTLRGALGTLMDRRGNSLDRALLLARLLRSSKATVRLARATLGPELAAQIGVQIAVSVPGVETAAQKNGVLTELDAFARELGLDAAEVRASVEQAEQKTRAVRDGVRVRVQQQTDLLARRLGLSSSAAPETSREDLQALQDHWWVQWNNGSGWSDLDPDAPRAGATLIAASEFVDPGALPADLHHTIQVRVIVEKWDGEKLIEAQPVSVDLRASDVLGQAIRLQHVPLAWPAAATDAAAIKQNAVSQREWLPVFQIGKRQVAQASVQDTGDVNEKPGTGVRSSPGEGLADALGGGDPAPASIFTAEWIEYVIRVPGRTDRIIRREVFDILGADTRVARRAPQELSDTSRLSRAMNLLNETEILVLSGHLSSAYVNHIAASRMVSYQGILEDALAATNAGPSPVDRLNDLEPLPGLLHSFAVIRGEWSSSPDFVDIREPNILTSHVFPRSDANGTVALTAALDVVANEVTPYQGSAAEQFRARLEQGVLDANVEAVLLGSRGGALADRFGLPSDQARWVPVRTIEDLDRVAIGGDIRARLAADLRQGFALLMYNDSDPAHAEWWRVNPKTGDTLSIGNRGWGQATVEYGLLKKAVIVFGLCMVGASLNGTPSRTSTVMCFMLGAAFVGAFFVDAGLVLGGFVGGQITTVGGAIILSSTAFFGYALVLGRFQ